MGELASIMRKGRHFLITNAKFLPLTASSTKDVPDLSEWPFVLDTSTAGYTQCKPCEGFKMYIAAEMWQNLKQFF